MKIRILIPMKENLHLELVKRCGLLLDDILNKTRRETGWDVGWSIDMCGNPVKERGLQKLVAHTIKIRQRMAEKELRDHPDADYFLWIDADIVKYPADILIDLVNLEKSMHRGAIVAPAVLLEKCRLSRNGERWYDTCGFIENGNWARLRPPYFEQGGDIVSLDSVGAFYLVPTEVYRTGGRHEVPENPKFSDHYTLCQHAKQIGMRVICDTSLKVYHAYLPYYGEELH